MHVKITLSLLFAVITVNNAENKFSAFRNATKSSQNQGNKDQNEVLKTEIKKYMSECGADVSGEETSDSKYSNQNSSTNKNKGDDYYNTGNYHGATNSGHNNSSNRGNSDQSYGNSNYNTGSGYSAYGNSGSNRDFGQDRGNNGNYPQTNDGNWGGSNSGSYGNSHGNTGYNNSGMGSYTGNYGYGSESGGYGTRSTDSMGMNNRRSDYGSGTYSSASGSAGYGYNGGYMRPKRSEDDIECISQCVFGYLEVLDDNRSPSEMALIKWLQDHLPSDSSRIKIIRETRRCFARLAASDTDDGCEFSKTLSKCLNLEIEK